MHIRISANRTCAIASTIFFPILIASLQLRGRTHAQELGSDEIRDTLDALVVKSNRELPQLATDAFMSTKSNVQLIDYPKSVSVIKREEFEHRGSQSVQEALTYTPGAITGIGGADSRVDDVMIRGFEAGGFTSNSYLDGLRAPTGGQWTTTQFDLFGLERLEVVKGPSSALFGQVAPGGLVNMVSKHPRSETAGLASLQFGSFDTFQAAADATGAIDSDRRFLYRTVALYRQGGSQIDHTDLERIFIAPSITWQPNEDLSLSILTNFQQDNGGSTYQFLPVIGTLIPAPGGKIDRSQFIGEPDFNTYDRNQHALGYELRKRIGQALTLTQNARITQLDTLYEGVVAGRTPPDAAGNMSRRAVRGVGQADGFAIDTRLEGYFESGPISHNASVGFDYLTTSWEHRRDGTNSVPNINIFNPVYTGISAPLTPQVSQDAGEYQRGLYIQDQVSVGGWRLSLGARYDRSDSKILNRINQQTSSTNDAQFSGHVGLLYHLKFGLSPYLSYATSFEPVVGATSSGNAFEPTEGKQFEIGFKYEPVSYPASFTVSTFDLTQINILTPDPLDPILYQVQMGQVEIAGLEIGGKADVTDQLSITGGFTVMDAEITRDHSGNEGNNFRSVPDQSVALWVDYQFPDGVFDGLAIGAGMRYVSSRPGDNGNLYNLPSYTLFDAAIRCDLGRLHETLEGASISLSGINLADRVYVAKAETATSANYGIARTINLNLTYSW